MTGTMRGGQLIAETLKRLGVTDLFSLPGAQTMGLYEGLRQAGGIRLHSTVQEVAAVGAADGLARVTGRLTAANVYSFPGLANAVCAIYSAHIDRSPVLVLGTLTDARQAGRGWSSEVPDLIGFAQQCTKLALEVPRADRLEEVLRRAAQVALTPPMGPVYVGVPSNMYLEEVPAPTGKIEVLRSSATEMRSDDEGIRKIAEMILSDEKVALVGGGDVGMSGAWAELESLSEEYALPIYLEPYAPRLPVGTNHPYFFRVLFPTRCPTYKDANVVVAIGAMMAKRFSYFPFEYVLAHQRFAHINSDANTLGRAYPTEVAVHADARVALLALRRALDGLVDPRRREVIDVRRKRLRQVKAAYDEARMARARGKERESPADIACALYQIGQAIRPEDLVVDELIGLRHWWPVYMDVPNPDRYIGTQAGFMGWGASAAAGMALGLKQQGAKGKAILLTGDGCFLMAPQAMWNAAHDKAPVVFVITNNQGWICLKSYYDVVRGITGSGVGEPRIGCDFSDPPIDYVAMARSYGVPGVVVRSAGEVRAAMQEALTCEGPYLIDLILPNQFEDMFDFPKP